MILKKPLIQSFSWFVNEYRENVKTIIHSTIEDVVNEDQYNQSEIKDLNIDITYNKKGNMPTSISVYGNGEGMDMETLQNNYFYMGADNKLDGRGQYGDGGKQGAVWGTKNVITVKDGKLSEAYISPYRDGSDSPKKTHAEVSFNADESKFITGTTYTVESLIDFLSSNHGTLVVTEIQKNLAKQQKWINRDDIKEHIDNMSKYYHLRHTLNSSKVKVKLINYNTGKIEKFDLEKPNEINLIDLQTHEIKPELSGIRMDERLRTYEQNPKNSNSTQGVELPVKPSESNITIVIGEIEDALRDQTETPDPEIRKSGLMFMSDNGEIFDNRFGPQPYERKLLAGIDTEFANMIGGKVILPEQLFRALQKSTDGDFLTKSREGMNIKNDIVKSINKEVQKHVQKYLLKIKAKYQNSASESMSSSFDFSSKAKEYNELKAKVLEEDIDTEKGKPLGVDFFVSPPGLPIKTGDSKSIRLVVESSFVDKIESIEINSSNDLVAAEEEFSISDDIRTTQSLKAWYPHEKWPEFKRTSVSITGKSPGSAEIEFDIKLKNHEKLVGSPAIAKINVSDEVLPEIDENEMRFEKQSYSANLKTKKTIKVLFGSAIGAVIQSSDITLKQIEGVVVHSQSGVLHDERNIVTSNNLTSPYYAQFVISLNENLKKDINTLECVVKLSVPETNEVEEQICKTKIKKLKENLAPQWIHLTKKSIDAATAKGDNDPRKILGLKKAIHVVMGEADEGVPDKIYFITPHKLFKNYIELNDKGEIEWAQNLSLLHVSRIHAAYALGIQIHQDKYAKPQYIRAPIDERDDDEIEIVSQFLSFFNDISPNPNA